MLSAVEKSGEDKISARSREKSSSRPTITRGDSDHVRSTSQPPRSKLLPFETVNGIRVTCYEREDISGHRFHWIPERERERGIFIKLLPIAIATIQLGMLNDSSSISSSRKSRILRRTWPEKIQNSRKNFFRENKNCNRRKPTIFKSNFDEI